MALALDVGEVFFLFVVAVCSSKALVCWVLYGEKQRGKWTDDASRLLGGVKKPHLPTAVGIVKRIAKFEFSARFFSMESLWVVKIFGLDFIDLESNNSIVYQWTKEKQIETDSHAQTEKEIQLSPHNYSPK